MLVCGCKKNEDVDTNLFKGNLEECKAYCKKLVPADFYSLDIVEDNGLISKRIFLHGTFAEDFFELLS